MRINPRCPGCLHLHVGHLLHPHNGQGCKIVLVTVLLVAALVAIVTVTYVQSHLLWHQDREVHSHHRARSKFSVAVATDVSDPTLNYGVVVDCGSSGSRVYVYFWPPHDGNPKELLDIQPMRDSHGNLVIKKIEPGISSFANEPSKASEYLRPLLQFVANHLPLSKHKETPLYILATAGMRFLPESEQTAIMDDLRVDIPMEFNFLFGETHVEVISGKQEGVYAWVAINYILGKFDHEGADDPLEVVDVPGTDGQMHVRKRTVGMIDMGGGSAQIAYEVPKSEDVAKNLLAEFNLGCTSRDLDHTYRVYVTTFLGYGGNAARRRYEAHLISSTVPNPAYNQSSPSFPGLSESSAIPDPCLPVNMPQTVSLGEGTYHLLGTGDFNRCRQLVVPLLNQSVTCMKEPCSMNGVYQPPIDYRHSQFYGFAEFYYTMEDVLRMSGKYDYAKFNSAAQEYCSTSWPTLDERYNQKLYPKADENRMRMQCFKSAWMSVVLHDGLRFPRTYRSLTATQLVNDQEVQWTLGALIYKTRFYPLSEIQKHESHHYQPPWRVDGKPMTYSILFCFVIVLAAILIYLRRLKIVRRPDLRKVPSMAMFMTEENQVLEGITTSANYP